MVLASKCLLKEKKLDQIVEKVIELLEIKYGMTCIKKVEDCVREWFEFKKEQYEE